MSLWSRVANVFLGRRLSREIDEEFESHVAEAIGQGRDPAEARPLGRLRRRVEHLADGGDLVEASGDVAVHPVSGAEGADIAFGLGQTAKRLC